VAEISSMFFCLLENIFQILWASKVVNLSSTQTILYSGNISLNFSMNLLVLFNCFKSFQYKSYGNQTTIVSISKFKLKNSLRYLTKSILDTIFFGKAILFISIAIHTFFSHKSIAKADIKNLELNTMNLQSIFLKCDLFLKYKLQQFF
jgi:hypothetical protein